MRQHISTPHAAATWLFCLGLALVSSGWGPVLSRVMERRPSWSVCGQAMCMCQPADVPDAEPACPLCEVAAPSHATRPAIDPGRIALRHSGNEPAMSRLDAAAESFLIGLFLVGARPADDARALARARLALSAWSLPASLHPDAPVPPPRA